MSVPRTAQGADASAPRDESPMRLDHTLDAALQLVLTRVRLHARRRAEWLRTLWREQSRDVMATQFSQVTHHEVDLSLDDRDHPAAELDWTAAWMESAEARELAATEQALAADTTSRLERLRRTFSLSATEVDLLHTCIAGALDPSLLRVFAYLQDHAARAYVTDALIARLFERGRSLLIDADAPSVRWEIVRCVEIAPGEPRCYVLDDAIREWLLGSDALDADLAGACRVHESKVPLAAWPVAETVDALRGWFAGPSPASVQVRVVGARGSGRRTFAAAVAERLGLPLLAVDTEHVDDARWPRTHLLAQRRAFLDGCALAFSGDRAFAPPPGLVATFPLEFLICETPRPAPASSRAVDHLVQLPALTLDDRRALWQLHAPWIATWPADALENMIVQHRALPADVERIGRRGPSSAADAAQLLREASRESLGALALRLECPFTPDDLVLNLTLRDALDDLLFEARERVAFWERPEARRLFPQGRGLLALFSGPPGTGKTMSAQVIAATLGMELYRIDLSSVVSKWVGETSRNLDTLLTRAAQRDVVLLFDEADALFGKRTDIKEANDRFANTDTGYLLQAIESYHGIALLSTNRKSDIDSAFLRRLRYVLDYPLPDQDERLRLWEGVTAELLGATASTAMANDLRRLASAVEVTGAQIKFSVLSAIFTSRRDAAEVDLAHLVRGLERELAKEGRPIGERVRERLGSRAG